MRQSLIKNYHQDSSASTSFDDPSDAATPPWKTYNLPGIVRLLASRSLLSGQMVQTVQSQLSIARDSEALLGRSTTHLMMILLIVLAIALSKAPLSWSEVGAIRPLKPAPAIPTVQATEAEAETPLTLPAQLNTIEDDVLVRGAVPQTIIPERTKLEITNYIVQSGDTIFGIAARHGLAPETLMWSNPALQDNPDLLSLGQELTILPVDGVYHQVGGGDTIEGIASTYKSDPQAIIDFPLNEIDPEAPTVQTGAWVVVPGGSKPFVPRTVTAYTGPIPDDATLGTGIFSWPASGTIFQGYWSVHPGLDIAAWTGAPITAADSGHVVAAGWDDTGYGYSVVVDHGNGFQTLYAHLQAYYVDPGENVAKGQQIGEMGSTGNSTGPHLHFEVRQGTIQRNPAGFLP